MDMDVCRIDGCLARPVGRGWCRKHYMRWNRTGDPEKVRSRHGMTESDRFWDQVEKRDGHWLWTGGKSSGYGLFGRSDGRTQQAHRFAWEDLIGPIPDGLVLDHLKDRCGNRACVKVLSDESGPNHLEPVTSYENWRRGTSFSTINLASTHCIHGHEFTEENTYTKPDGGRQCKACRRITDKNRPRYLEARAKTARS